MSNSPEVVGASVGVAAGAHVDVDVGADETPLESYDGLDAINESTELQCLLQQHIDTTTYGNDSAYCLTHFDSILCWPRTPRGTLAALPCLHEFQGIQYDSSQNATRFCHANGTWEKYTNYDLCMHLPAPSTVPEFEPIIELPTIIYYIGYTISLVSLTLAIIVFAYFKELRCLRNSIHANLFFTYIMSALLWILTLSVHISIRTGLGGCVVLVTLFHFFTLTNFFWMLVEGLYLYMLVVKTFSGDNIRFNIYAIIGWGGPAGFVVIWAIAKGLTISYDVEKFDIGCPWMRETHVDWIFQGPVCAVLIMNLIFLLRIMWGFAVSLFYCFLNSEVRNTLRHHISTWRDERNIQLNQSRRYTTKSFSKDCSPRTESTRPLTAYYGKGKRESSVSSATTTTLLGHNQSLSVNANISAAMALQHSSNGTLHTMPTVTALTVMPRAISPLMKQGLEENSV
ncbi:diuretic hormone receptor isoform X2 [Bactrocera dorsalis]|uniref:Diuretic hormone receptor isoform X2 n=1 Tax=Bactrocera dorsalis TaxID=27457 RepID=A0ABM3JFA1_BACDO|nr:diuretic hormone receptor isoform X2 [Bactrocera dorsalis]